MIHLSDKKVKARIEHKCNYCNGTIKPGNQYRRSVWVGNNGPYTWKAHVSCDKIVDSLGLYDWEEDGVTQEIFFDGINDKYQELRGITWHEMANEKTTFLNRLTFVKYHCISLEEDMPLELPV